jgi:hypothetical protein
MDSYKVSDGEIFLIVIIYMVSQLRTNIAQLKR